MTGAFHLSLRCLLVARLRAQTVQLATAQLKKLGVYEEAEPEALQEVKDQTFRAIQEAYLTA